MDERVIDFRPIPRKRILEVTLLSEGLLITISVIWFQLRSPVYSPPSLKLLILGLAGTFLILAFNFFVFDILAEWDGATSQLNQFKKELIVPICAALDPLSAIIVSVLAGLGEELFFRGLIQYELDRNFGLFFSLIVTNVTFSIVHFGPSVARFYQVFLLYFLTGIFLSYFVLMFGSLIPVIIVHSLYNFLAITYVRHIYVPRIVSGKIS